ncbi:MAG: APC family permease [Actinomycetota bacterium]|nr:APC family permease [Actinomycetota bacterium]
MTGVALLALLAGVVRTGPAHPAGAAVLKRTLIGRPRASSELHDTLLSKKLALPIFASDLLSSVAYATEAALVVLVAASASGAHLVLPISIAIAALLGVVILSYRQTVHAYQTSGGAYVVARDNLGTFPSLVAAGALLVDYVLTVAVSVTAGVLALTSAVPSLEPEKVELSLLFVAALTVANLRGVREAGALFAIPTYAFVVAMFAMVGTGIGKCLAGACPQAHVSDPVTAGVGAVGVLVVLRAFASGAAALTGVEAISNGVGAFRPPKAKNASQTLAIMGAIAISLFVGVSYLAVETGARPSETTSLLSEIARAVFPASSPSAPMYFVVQALTFGILVLAANTAYQGFPRLAAVLASDRFFPRQFVNLGDRLVYSNGIVVLAGIAAALIWAFHANVISLIHLYVIGVFTALTLSQAGMVRHWRRARGAGWRRRASFNAIGAAATGIVTVLVIQTKFGEGAWMVTIAIPTLVVLFLAVHRHYRRVGRRLRAGALAVRAAPEAANTVVVYVESGDSATALAAWYAREIADGRFRAVHVPDPRRPNPPDVPREIAGVPVEILADGESPTDSVLEYVWALPHGESSFVTLVVPELFDRASLLRAAVRRRTTFALKVRLLSEPGIAIADVPVVAESASGFPPPEPNAVARVLVSSVQAASLRAIAYARSLDLADTRAVFFCFEEEEARRMTRDWEREGIELPLEIVEAPYRDLGGPLRDYVRRLTADPDVVVSVVMPELVFSGWRALLHNQHALYIKRLLLFEPRVLLTSVPFHLR